MKIVLAEHFGMCFGVRDALAQAEQLAEQAPLTILGELVHNPIVRERLRAVGVDEGSLDRLDVASGTVMITAHGASDAKRARWRGRGFHVVDGTCPLVRHAHEQLKRLVATGYFPVVIGKLGHVEVHGLTEDFPGASVVEVADDILKLPHRDRYGVISQTTQPIERARALVTEIERLHPASEVRFVDTVCKPTKIDNPLYANSSMSLKPSLSSGDARATIRASSWKVVARLAGRRFTLNGQTNCNADGSKASKPSG